MLHRQDGAYQDKITIWTELRVLILQFTVELTFCVGRNSFSVHVSEPDRLHSAKFQSRLLFPWLENIEISPLTIASKWNSGNTVTLPKVVLPYCIGVQYNINRWHKLNKEWSKEYIYSRGHNTNNQEIKVPRPHATVSENK